MNVQKKKKQRETHLRTVGELKAEQTEQAKHHLAVMEKLRKEKESQALRTALPFCPTQLRALCVVQDSWLADCLDRSNQNPTILQYLVLPRMLQSVADAK